MMARRRRTASAFVAALLGTALVAAACGGVTSAPSSHHGEVKVLYAASLLALMENHISPAFHKATGYQFTGYAGGSQALATEIKGKVRRGDIFISAAPAVDTALGGTGNGDWVKWYATFAKSPLVLGYNPKSSFASAFKSRPWYDVLSEPGIKVGRTDPALDPKGKLTVTALTQAASDFHESALLSLARSQSSVFPEETLVGRLQSGQLDAGFFYTVEAKQAGIPTVPITPISLASKYTVTVLKGAPNQAGADALVKFLLGTEGRRLLAGAGLTLVAPAEVVGSPPSELKPALTKS